MLTEKEIKEAESNVRTYLANEELKKKKSNRFTINALINNSDESLNVAKYLYDENISPLWVIVCSYYSMFYMANAILSKLGYKVGDHNPHKITSDALIVFVRNKLKKKFLEDYDDALAEAIELGRLSDEIIHNLELERRKRSKFQYKMTKEVLKGQAKTSLDRAKDFVVQIEQLIDEIK
ncbi:MAG: HEPN domain-containing protein [Methanobacteriaceae archaeon]|jgi:uncharacterized protein (UPF0332 family)|nr:HEPN domain-containing protein [Methanobacteriaceae archaeon]OPY23310.1 MAG: hypothetical protein A4E26_00920 [Methanobacterium sp. PtaU1.Bin097]